MSVSCTGKNLGKESLDRDLKLSEENKLKSIVASKHRYKPVYFYDPDSLELITIYESLNSACRAESANKTNFLNCIKTTKKNYFFLVEVG